MNNRLFLFAVMFLLFGFTARAQQDSLTRFVRYGVFGSAGVNVHTPQFFFPERLYYTTTSPPQTFRFEPTTTFGWSAGGLIEQILCEVLNDFSWKNLSCWGAVRHPSEAHEIVLFDMDTDLRRYDGTMFYQSIGCIFQLKSFRTDKILPCEFCRVQSSIIPIIITPMFHANCIKQGIFNIGSNIKNCSIGRCNDTCTNAIFNIPTGMPIKCLPAAMHTKCPKYRRKDLLCLQHGLAYSSKNVVRR